MLRIIGLGITAVFVTANSNTQPCLISCFDKQVCVDKKGLMSDCSGFKGCYSVCPTGSYAFRKGTLILLFSKFENI